MKPLTLEETGLKEELKRQYYEKEKLGIKNSRENFKMLCHLEDFEIQYWELLKENKELKLELSGYRQAILEDKDMLGLKEEAKELKEKYLNAVADYETTMSELQELKKENKILRKNAENNDKVVDKVNWENMLLKKENKQLKDNWNKLKEWASNFYNSEEVGRAGCGMRYTLEKMQELEGSDNNGI